MNALVSASRASGEAHLVSTWDSGDSDDSDDGFWPDDYDVDPESAERALREWRDHAFDRAWANARIITSDSHRRYTDWDEAPFIAEMRAEMLTTNAGWIEFVRRVGEVNPALEMPLAALPPPRVWWQRATATTGVSIDVSQHASIDEEWDESILTVVVSITQPAEGPTDGWLVLDQGREVLVGQTREWAVSQVPLDYLDVEIKWRLLGDASPCTVHVPRSADMFAMTAIAIDEASERVWNTVPWWRDDNDAGRLILDRTLAAASRGCDVRVITRPPTGQYNERSALSVLEHLQRRPNVRVAFNQTEHSKLYIADEVSVLGSANLTWSDERNENAGTFTTGEGTRQRAQSFQHQWRGLLAADEMEQRRP